MNDPDDPDSPWIDAEQKAYLASSLRDPGVVVAVGFFHGDPTS